MRHRGEDGLDGRAAAGEPGVGANLIDREALRGVDLHDGRDERLAVGGDRHLRREGELRSGDVLAEVLAAEGERGVDECVEDDAESPDVGGRREVASAGDDLRRGVEH